MLRATAVCICLIASTPSCPDLYALATHGFTEPALHDEGATAAPAGLSGVLLSITISANNPNAFAITLDAVDYSVALDGDVVFTGTQDGLTVDAGGSGKLTASGVVSVTQPVFARLQPGMQVPYVISGTAHFESPAGVPVDVEFSLIGSVMVPSELPPFP
jgi:hypothetical protein